MTSNPYRFHGAQERDNTGTAFRFELPAGGKVTGSVVVQYVGHGIIVGTEGAHINDDNIGLEYNGDGYIGRVWVKRDQYGEWIADPDNMWNKTRGYDTQGSFTRRDNWSDAGKLADRMIVRALCDLITEHYDEQADALGRAHEAEREAFRAWDDHAKTAEAERAARKALRAAERTLAKARDAIAVYA
jgi:hypothetical protein